MDDGSEENIEMPMGDGIEGDIMKGLGIDGDPDAHGMSLSMFRDRCGWLGCDEDIYSHVHDFFFLDRRIALQSHTCQEITGCALRCRLADRLPQCSYVPRYHAVRLTHRHPAVSGYSLLCRAWRMVWGMSVSRCVARNYCLTKKGRVVGRRTGKAAGTCVNVGLGVRWL
jgi:hypothetical protein